MSKHDNLNKPGAPAEIDQWKDINSTQGETVFMRMLHELQSHRVELERQYQALHEARQELEITRNRFAHLYDNSPLSYFTLDSKGIILEVNLTGAAMLGRERSSLIGVPVVNFVAQKDRQNFMQRLHVCLSGEALPNSELSLDLQAGKSVSVQIICLPTHEAPNHLESCQMVFIDVTDRKLTELKLRLASSALENAQEGIVLTDASRKIVAVNPAFTNVCGYSAEEVIGHMPSILKSGRHDVEFYRNMNATLLATDSWQGEIWNRHKNGDIYPEWLNIKAIRNENGEVDCYVGIFSDLANQEKVRNRLYELAFYDELTGLSNRSLLYDRLHHELIQTKRSASLMAILFIDLDRFKLINDTRGHEAGDYVLKETATRLLSCIREGDTLSRLGGDEFVAILKDIENEGVPAQVAGRMVNSLTRPFVLKDSEMFVTASVGISLHPKDGDEVSVLLRNADAAMYYAKQQGRNNFKYFEDALAGYSFYQP